MQPRGTVPAVVFAIHVGARLGQRQRRLRVAVPRRIVQRRHPAQPKQALLPLHPEWTDRPPPHCGKPMSRGCSSEEPYPSLFLPCTSAPLASSATTVFVSPASAAGSSSLLCNKDAEPLNHPPRRAQAEWTQTHLLAVPIEPSGVLGTITLGSTGHSAVLGGGVSGDLQPATGRSWV